MILSVRYAASFVLAIVLVVCNAGLHAEEADVPRVNATYLTTAPTPDGDVVNDPAWDDATPLTEFTQQIPSNGEPATMATHVYVGFTETDLHVAFIAYEDDINDMSPSQNGWQSDSVIMVIDPYRNEISGVAFSTNQTGVEWDASTFNGNSNWNWSTVWDAEAKVNEDNWSVEMVIPFTSLQYPRQDVQSWSFNFGRVIKNRNEVSHWSPIPRQFSIWRLALAGIVEDIRPPPSKRNVKFNPYVITAEGQGRDAELVNRSDFGFDVLYSLTPTLNLTGTYNTDFAQVETDQLQINTGRFSLFYPETRPFFLENSQLFNIGVPGETLVFHSRRIGIARNGARLRMDGGLKLAGYMGSKNELGMMLLRADSAAGDGEEDFGIARYKRYLANRSSVGILATQRDTSPVSSNTFAADAQLGIGEHAEIRTFAATSNADDGVAREDEYSYAMYGTYSSPDWQSSASYHEVGSGFNPAIGFVQRRNSRKAHIFVQRSLAMNDKWGMNEWKPFATYTTYQDFDGVKQSSSFHLETWWVWNSGADFWAAVRTNEENVQYPFSIVGQEVPVDEYEFNELILGFNTPYENDWGIGGNLNKGGFYQGDRTAAGLFGRYTFNERVTASLSHNRNDVDFPNLEQPFSFSLSAISISVAFTPEARLSAFVQYNDADKVLSTNVRFAWLRSASTGLYLVYSEVDENGFAQDENRSSLVLKYSHMFDMNF